jgi:hypothetical protein
MGRRFSRPYGMLASFNEHHPLLKIHDVIASALVAACVAYFPHAPSYRTCREWRA